MVLSTMGFSKIYTSEEGGLWEKNHTIPFDELILSWNGRRPNGKWTFWVSFYQDEWLKYAEWGSKSQKSFHSKAEHSYCYQDVAVPKEKATSFKVKVTGEELNCLKRLTVCLSNLEKYQQASFGFLKEVHIQNVPKLSQMVLDHPRHKDLCSPTSTTIVSNFFLKNKKIDPVDLAKRCHDQEFDIYGNWILNVAASFEKTNIPCHVERLNSFPALHAHLVQNSPVIVSIKGPLRNAPKPYANGHLMCVIGYSNDTVFCIDPGFDRNESTYTSYDLKDFLECWKRRKNLAYVFEPTFRNR